MTNNTIIIIPARLSSNRLPNKPMLDFAGKPMIVRVWEKAIKTGVSRVVVASADNLIHETIKSAGGESIMTDPLHPSGTDRVAEAIKLLDSKYKFDKVINFQGDMPNVPAEYISVLLSTLNNSSVDIGTLVAPMVEKEFNDPNSVKVAVGINRKMKSGRAIYFSRALIPAHSGPYYHHIGLYAFRRTSLEKFVSTAPSYLEKREKLEQLRALEIGMRIEVGLVDKAPIGVDTKEDLKHGIEEYNIIKSNFNN